MFLGYLPDIANKFKKNAVLGRVFDYLYYALDEDNAVHKRICALQNGETYEVELEGGARAIEQAYQTKSPQKAFYESHIAMVDFQMVVSGVELFFIAPNTLCEVKQPLDSKRDLIEYAPSKFCSSIQLFPGNLAVFEPIDTHAGGIAISEPMDIKKVVVKVPKECVKLNF